LIGFFIIFPFSIHHNWSLNIVIKYCEFQNINQSAFKEDLKITSFVSAPASDLPELCDQYFKDLSLLLDKHVPLKSKEIKNNNNSDWMNEYYLMAKRARRQCKRQWRKYKTPSIMWL
jgi:hypothetical protein